MAERDLLRPKESSIETTAPAACKTFTYWLRTVRDYTDYLEGRAADDPAINKARIIVSCLSPCVLHCGGRTFRWNFRRPQPCLREESEQRLRTSSSSKLSSTTRRVCDQTCASSESVGKKVLIYCCHDKRISRGTD